MVMMRPFTTSILSSNLFVERHSSSSSILLQPFRRYMSGTATTVAASTEGATSTPTTSPTTTTTTRVMCFVDGNVVQPSTVLTLASAAGIALPILPPAQASSACVGGAPSSQGGSPLSPATATAKLLPPEHTEFLRTYVHAHTPSQQLWKRFQAAHEQGLLSFNHYYRHYHQQSGGNYNPACLSTPQAQQMMVSSDRGHKSRVSTMSDDFDFLFDEDEDVEGETENDGHHRSDANPKNPMNNTSSSLSSASSAAAAANEKVNIKGAKKKSMMRDDRIVVMARANQIFQAVRTLDLYTVDSFMPPHVQMQADIRRILSNANDETLNSLMFLVIAPPQQVDAYAIMVRAAVEVDGDDDVNGESAARRREMPSCFVIDSSNLRCSRI